MIEEDIVWPGHLVVAVLARLTLCAFVWVVLGMATVAARLQGRVIHRFDVAVSAFEILVRAVNLVVRIRIVVELHEGPVTADMAGLALATKMTIMVVVLDVAGHTGHFQIIGKRFVAVAVSATEVGM